ncbi:OmpA family protein [Teredinibacter purpureus]|uniref:OmpA family protein n=1 Tax=Teredinibacter purpureus TaxID=2731756 RepID=UPI000697E196|nr:OmpA family protein [Teredinibacter purpureus]
MTDEQVVIWYQTQLASVVAPVVSDPDFGQENKLLISDLSLDIQAIVNKAREGEQSLAKISQQYATEVATNKTERQRQAEFEARFRTIQTIFTSNEAEVYRQGNNVQIRSYGFYFPSGGSEIQSDNFPLLKKIIKATEQFPNSKIQVSGHTDNRGSDELNMSLSSERADKVAKFLVEVGNLTDYRVSSIGYGKTRPLASNETVEGRTANRRVEVLIIND